MSNSPNIPEGSKNTADIAFTLFKMHELEDAETRSIIPGDQVAIYSMVSTVAQGFIDRGLPKLGRRVVDLAIHRLRLSTSVKGQRTKDLLTPYELELHREQKKLEEKPKI